MKKLIPILILIIFVATFIILEITLPFFYEQRITRSLKEQVTAVKALDVDIHSRPALLLLGGRIQKGHLEATGVQFQGVRIQELAAQFKDLRLVTDDSGKRVLQGINNYFQAEILETDLNQYLEKAFPQFDYFRIKLDSDRVTLEVKLKNLLKLTVPGQLVITEEKKLRFVPMDEEKLELPSLVVSQILSLLEFDLGLTKAPLPLEIEEIQIVSGKLLVLGGNKR